MPPFQRCGVWLALTPRFPRNIPHVQVYLQLHLSLPLPLHLPLPLPLTLLGV